MMTRSSARGSRSYARCNVSNSARRGLRRVSTSKVANFREGLGVELDVHGETDEELADSYLKVMLRTDLIRRC